jgi:hypothetical protein
MQDCDPAQAAELVRALRDQLREMTHHLARVERRDVPGPNGHPLRLEAAALRRDTRGTVAYRSATAPLPERRRAHPTAFSRRTASGHGDPASQVIAKRPPAAE